MLLGEMQRKTTSNDEKETAAGTGQNQLSYLYQRKHLHDRYQYDQRHGPGAGTAKKKDPKQGQVIRPFDKTQDRIIYPPICRAAYAAALCLVAGIDEDLATGRRHYRNQAGVLLTTLDEIVRAILNNELEGTE